MNLRLFSWLKGKHAKLSPSQAHRWANKDMNQEQLYRLVNSSYAQEIGTLLHAFVEDDINYRVKMIQSDKKEIRKHLLKHGIPESIALEYVDRCFDVLMSYVNDAIGFRMDAEVELAYSSIPIKSLRALGINPVCFGTADAISFKENKLRIHDLKTGIKPAHMDQLITYAALFCLQNNIKPHELEDIELRIYQADEPIVFHPEVDDIIPIMDRIKKYDKWLIEYLIEEEVLDAIRE